MKDMIWMAFYIEHDLLNLTAYVFCDLIRCLQKQLSCFDSKKVNFAQNELQNV